MIHQKTIKDTNFDKLSRIHLDKSSLAIFLAICASKLQKVAYFLNLDSRISSLKDEISMINPELEVLDFPGFDCSFFSNISPTIKNKSQRIKTLYKLIFPSKKNFVFLGSYESLITKTINREDLRNSRLILKKNSSLKYNFIIQFLNKSGYQRVDFVYNKGEFSIRGEILDIFSSIYEYPVRILFDLDEIESINLFSTESQISSSSVNEYILFLSSEFQFTEENIKCFRESFRKFEIKDKSDYYKALSDNIILPGSEQFFPILSKKHSSILDYLNNFSTVFDINYEQDFLNFSDSFIEEFGDYKVFLRNESNFLLKDYQLKEKLKKRKIITIQNSFFLSNDEPYTFSENLELFNSKNKNLTSILKLLRKKKSTIFCYNFKSNKRKIVNFLNSNNISYKKLNSFQISKLDMFIGKVFIFEFEVESSFILKLDNLVEIFFISENDIFEKTIKKNTINIVEEENIIEEYSQLKIGDYVVHLEHGIGKYNGLKIKELNNSSQDFIEILYHDNDKLLIPVENLDLITKYGESEIKATLDRLGLQSWQHRKAIVKKRIKDIANALIKTAAERKLKKGDVLIPQTLEYEKFSSEFEFTETSDQIKSIHQIENDLSSGNSMDRLICGDVGFGKTEIAMRASFIAVSSGFQVAIICPKLLLVNQHTENFLKRYGKFNYKIEKLSRAESLKKKNHIKEELRSGMINIVIGTHALLSQDIHFHKLGLIIIDEEQSFGVEQKERLKKFKPNCHILTLSATPIPRTLQSSIFKIKNISLIKTAPVNRLNVKTFLMLHDKKQIKKIISREVDRGGQVFYVTPRIADLEKIKKNLINLLPNLRFDFIHGQLPSRQIENSYERFFKKDTQLLISTAMIESGLDISNVNTIIIEKPYLFGLSQLYQLRGRVGRSSRQAYAYLIVENFQKIGEDSLKKIQIISRINSLGAGLSIASNDLDMRGAGNIVGSEQSGHIKEIGVELYYKMVKEAINELEDVKHDHSDWSPSINLNFSISIPENYVKNLDLRLNIYRKISNINDIKQLNEILEALKDRFGDLPESFKNLFDIIEIRIIAKRLFIKKIDCSNKGFVLEFKPDKVENVERLLKFVKKNTKLLKLMPDSRLFFINNKLKNSERVNDLKKLLMILSG